MEKTFQDRLRAILDREVLRLDSASVTAALSDSQLKALESLSRIARHLGKPEDDEEARAPVRTPRELVEAIRGAK